MYHINNAVHSFESFTEMYGKILESWDIDIGTVSDISLSEGTLIFTQDGKLSSCPACELHTYSNIVRYASGESRLIRERVKSIFWKHFAEEECRSTIQILSKQSQEALREKKDMEYILTLCLTGGIWRYTLTKEKK